MQKLSFKNLHGASKQDLYINNFPKKMLTAITVLVKVCLNLICRRVTVQGS